MLQRSRWGLLLGCLVCLMLGGCGRGLSLGKVSGRVTVAGKPVTSGTIMFHPESENAPAAVGAIGPDGTYTLTTVKAGDGAVVGSHRVTIQATTVGEGSLVEAKSLEQEMELARMPPGRKVLVPGKVTWVVPEKYSQLQTSTLAAKVESGSNKLDFEVPRQ